MPGKHAVPRALIVIDVQKGFDHPGWGNRNNPKAELQIKSLLACFRKLPVSNKIVHVRHDSIEADSPLRPLQHGHDFKEEAIPLEGERVECKNVNSALIGTGLEQFLRDNNIKDLVLCGLTTDHCVSTTARMAANLGFNVTVVEDATATFNRTGPGGKAFLAQDVHEYALASLNQEFARIASTAQVIEETRLLVFEPLS